MTETLWRIIGLGVLVALIVIALTACGSESARSSEGTAADRIMAPCGGPSGVGVASVGVVPAASGGASSYIVVCSDGSVTEVEAP